MKKLFILSLIIIVLCNGDDNHDKCGYASCKDYDPKLLNVHLVPHSHDDVAWKKTFDQYYYEDVRHILDSVVESLWMNPKRKFIYVETAFFWKWWRLQCSEVRTRVQVLVQLGQLQFAGGAWSMNDEATTHYQSIIDQFTYGRSKLDEAFGPCARPLVGWQIDPFGHSREFASLLAAMGYDALILDRIEHYDKERRKKLKQMEMIWRGDDDLGESSDIFTSVLSDSYNTPPRFCFDEMMRCGNKNNQYWFNLNPEETIRLFRMYIENQAQFYRTNNVLVPMGGDFHFQHAKEWYMYLDKMIELLNSKKDYKMKAFYSTPNCYIEAVKRALNYNLTNLPKKHDDFFPYANEPNKYWTGFYTSRPSLKLFERDANRYFQMVKQLHVLAELSDNNLEFLEEFKSAMGLMQHHDSITGTEQDHVARDLRKILDRALEDSLVIANQAFNKHLKMTTQLHFTRCPLNESSCHVSERSNQFIISVYNPLAWEVLEPIRIPVTSGIYEVHDPKGDLIQTQLVEISNYVKEMPTRKSRATHELCFLAKIKPVSFKTFFIKKNMLNNTVNENTNHVIEKKRRNIEFDNTIKTEEKKKPKTSPLDLTNGSYFENKFLKLQISKKGETSLVILRDNTEIDFFVQFYQYIEDVRKSSHSGAYVFASGILESIFLNLTNIIKGHIVHEATFTDKAVHNTIRIYNELKFIESEWVVGPIDVSDGIGKQIIVKYINNFKTDGIFYTDSNGRQTMKRMKNEKSFKGDLQDHVAGNYYPITNKIYIKDGKSEMAVLTDRSQGGSSLSDGEIEIMLHRRLLKDDSLGVEQPLNEMEEGQGLVVRGKHRIFFSKVDILSDIREGKKQVIQYHLQPIVLFADAKEITYKYWLDSKNVYSWIKNIPEGIHILTLEPYKIHTVLLRLENYQVKSDEVIFVNLTNIFTNLAVESYLETKLAGDFELNENYSKDFVVSLKPRQIRTFVLYLV